MAGQPTRTTVTVGSSGLSGLNMRPKCAHLAPPPLHDSPNRLFSRVPGPKSDRAAPPTPDSPVANRKKVGQKIIAICGMVLKSSRENDCRQRHVIVQSFPCLPS